MEFKFSAVERDIAMANLLYAWSVGWDSDPRWQEAAQRLWSEFLMRADGEEEGCEDEKQPFFSG